MNYSKRKFLFLGPGLGIIAALTFGIGIPVIKWLVNQVHPLLLSGLVYSIAGVFLLFTWKLNSFIAGIKGYSGEYKRTSLSKKDLPLLSIIILSGSVLAPLLLLIGLSMVEGNRAALLLNFELIFTIGMAVIIFHERLGRKGWIGCGLIISGALLLNSEGFYSGVFSFEGGSSTFLILAACALWGVDNNLSQKLSCQNPYQLGGIKGTIGGGISLSFAFIMSVPLNNFTPYLGLIAAVGIVSIGFSLIAFILSLRYIGTVKSGTLFATAPLFGVMFSVILLGENPGYAGLTATILMGVGIWGIGTDHHHHFHAHNTSHSHSHLHFHDGHHAHKHPRDIVKEEPHSHWHVHELISHAHDHSHDVHHRHAH